MATTIPPDAGSNHLPANALGSAGRGDILSYEISAREGIPAHTGAVVIIEDGPGVTRHYSWYQAACGRVLRQDAWRSDQLIQTRSITTAVQGRILRYLTTVCSTTANSFRETLELGTSLLRHYPRLGVDEQVVWLAQDLYLRESTLPSLPTFLESGKYFAQSPTLQMPQERQPYLDDVNALETLIGIFREQISHIRSMQISLLALLPHDKAIDLAPRCGLPAPVPTTISVPMNKVTPAPSVPSRAPLVPIPPNVKVRPAEPGGLKRKRTETASAKMTEVIDLCGSDGEDEEHKLQGQVDAINAKIAPLQKSTAHEDQLMPSKKARGQTKTLKTTGSGAFAAPTPSQTQNTAPRGSMVIESTITQSAAAQRRVLAAPAAMINPQTPNSNSADHRINIRVQMQGKTSLKLNIKTNTHFAKIIKAARKQWSIPEDAEAYLKLKGRRVDPGERVRRTTLGQYGFLDLHVVPAAATPKPLLKQVSIKPQNTGSVSQKLPHGQACSGPSGAARQPVMDLTSSSPASKDATPQVPRPIGGPPLCEEQQGVVDLILARKNVFYTGSAGCGKSTVLKAFVPRLRELGYDVRIIAPTGKAALDINGSTTWTFAGWTPLHMKRPLDELKKAAHGKFVNKRLRGTDVLVIDEISMVENHLFERLNAIMKEARGNGRPFGGVQLIVTGDFCQLPPVKPFQFCITCGKEQPQRIGENGRTIYRCPQHGDCRDEDKWAFRSAAWEECEFRHVNLTTIHRQSDEIFITILQKLRVGNPLTVSDRQLLLDHPCDVNNAVKLFPTRDQVKRINQTEFDRLACAKHSYTCLDYFWWNKELHPHLESKGKRSPFDQSLEALREHRLDSFVEFKKDMLVVLLVNLEAGSGLVNGSQGRIVDFEPYDPAKLPKARESSNGGGRMSSSKPTSFKSSESRTARDGSMEPDGPLAQGELRGEYAAMREGQIRWFINHPRNKSKMWPVVEFDNGIKRTIYADCQINELGDEKPYSLLARTQIPLIAAWAMTCHKSQGMTLNKVIVDLGKSFEEGQEYVALSRARSLDGLKVVALGEGVGKGGNVQVKEFLWQKFRI